MSNCFFQFRGEIQGRPLKLLFATMGLVILNWNLPSCRRHDGGTLIKCDTAGTVLRSHSTYEASLLALPIKIQNWKR